MDEGKRVEKKEITAGTTVKAVITGYVAYGILFGFVTFFLGIIASWIVNQFQGSNYKALSATVSVIEAIVIFFLVHWVCNLSIYDVFKSCKTNPKNTEKINKRLSLFVLFFIAISVVTVIFNVTLTLNNEKKSIAVASYQYSSIHSEEFVKNKTDEMLYNYERDKNSIIIFASILELGMIFTCITILPYQSKLIRKYNAC